MDQFQNRDREQAQETGSLDTPLGGQLRAQKSIAEELRSLISKPGTEEAPELRDDIALNYEQLAATLDLYAASHPEQEAIASIQEHVSAFHGAVNDYIQEMREHIAANLAVVYFVWDCNGSIDISNTVERRVLAKVKEAVKQLGRTAFHHEPDYYNTLKDALEDLRVELGNRADSLNFDSEFERLDTLRSDAEKLAVTRVDVRSAQDETLRSIDALLKANAK